LEETEHETFRTNQAEILVGNLFKKMFEFYFLCIFEQIFHFKDHIL